MLKIIDNKIITEKSGSLAIPEYCFGVADDETKTGWLLIYLLSNYTLDESRLMLLEDARNIISYCNMYSAQNKEVKIKRVMCNKNGKVNYLALTIENYGRAPKTIIYDSIVKAFQGYIQNIGFDDTKYDSVLISCKSNYLKILNMNGVD